MIQSPQEDPLPSKLTAAERRTELRRQLGTGARPQCGPVTISGQRAQEAVATSLSRTRPGLNVLPHNELPSREAGQMAGQGRAPRQMAGSGNAGVPPSAVARADGQTVGARPGRSRGRPRGHSTTHGQVRLSPTPMPRVRRVLVTRGTHRA